MKKVYIPSEEELQKMQDLTKINGIHHNGSIMYKYLLCKVIEALVVEGKLEDKSILEKTYRYFRENPQIAKAICKMYPEEIKFSDYAQNDIDLCINLAVGTTDQSIYSLDNLTHFQKGFGVWSNYQVQKYVIEALYEKLQTNPKYRFEYREPNALLDDIFLANLLDYFAFNGELNKQLTIIEPANALKMDETSFETYNSDRLINALKYDYAKYINQYTARYQMEHSCFPEYFDQDIVKNPDNNVKRLLRFLDRHKKTYQ